MGATRPISLKNNDQSLPVHRFHDVALTATAGVIGAIGPIARYPKFGQALTLAILAAALLGLRSRHRAVTAMVFVVVVACCVLSWKGDFARAAVAVGVGTLIALAALVGWPQNRSDGSHQSTPVALALLIVAEWHWFRNGSLPAFGLIAGIAAVALFLWTYFRRAQAFGPRRMLDSSDDSSAVQPTQLSALELAALRAKHARRLGQDVRRFSAGQGLWWVLPAVAIVVIVMAAASATTATVPYLVYTLF